MAAFTAFDDGLKVFEILFSRRFPRTSVAVGYGIAMLVAGFFAYLMFKSAVNDYKARKNF